MAHPASYTVGTGLFLGVKRPGLGVHHPSSSSAEVKEGIELYLCSPSLPSWHKMNITFTLSALQKVVWVYKNESVDDVLRK
jgi:hypothetical protein